MFDQNEPLTVNYHNINYKTINNIDNDSLMQNEFNENLDLLNSKNSNDRNFINYKLENNQSNINKTIDHIFDTLNQNEFKIQSNNLSKLTPSYTNNDLFLIEQNNSLFDNYNNINL